MLDENIMRYNPVRMIMDATGMGAMPFEKAQHRYGSIVEGIHFTHTRKMHLANLLKYRFQNRTIRIPINDELRRDLHTPQLSYSPSGLPILKAKNSHAKDHKQGHADRFWAMAMANEAANTNDFHVDYQGIQRSEFFIRRT